MDIGIRLAVHECFYAMASARVNNFTQIVRAGLEESGAAAVPGPATC